MATVTSENYPQLLSLAVHELRTPASVVGGYLRMLQRNTEEPLTDHQRKLIDEAEKSCARLVALIAEMSDIGKLDAGLLPLAQQQIDLNALVGDVAIHVHEGEDRDVRLVLDGDSAAAPMIGDRSRLRHAFDAVFRTVLREKAGPATVVAHRRRDSLDGRACMTIVVAESASVQEAYARARGPFNERHGGVGLALPLARRVFEGHGGQIWSPQAATADSEADDVLARTAAIVSLPLTE
ncbi:MAG TPA: HAMP domain-containing sensor histidine kinase [Vicinamibacterales bacterium]|jgi:signal transduction histidine kinase